MKLKGLGAFIAVLLAAGTLWYMGNRQVNTENKMITSIPGENPAEIIAIRKFMNDPELELVYVGTDQPEPYFRVGKLTKTGSGENLEKVDEWIRRVSVYRQKNLIGKSCSVYEYHLDIRSQQVVAVIIRGLSQSEIQVFKDEGKTCQENLKQVNVSKPAAEDIVLDILNRNVENFRQIKNQFEYLEQNPDGSHEWIWEDKTYKLPEGLSSRPYANPLIRISVYPGKQFQYWNTIPLFAPDK